MLYFIAGYQAAVNDQTGAGVQATKGLIGTKAVGTQKAPIDPRLNQMVTLQPGGLIHINRETVWKACQQHPDQAAGEVLKGLLATGASGSNMAK